MNRIYINGKFPHIIHGGDYNPDQWADHPEILDEDMRLMKLANCNEMSIGIFSWAKLEPKEGEYVFSFFDKVIDDIYKAGGRVILATPSGARPAWMSRKYPEVLRCNNRFERLHHGVRHNHCYTSPVYREKTAKINRLLAERYGNHPAVIAWHISNEYGGECYCPLCIASFREWLKEKYGTLDNLNKQWWTAFWSHTYTDWEQIEPPSPIGEQCTHGLALDWRRFVTYQTTDFMKNEISAIRSVNKDIPVTSNLMGFYKTLDYRVLAKELDFVSWDSYPAWKDNEKEDIQLACSTALTHDLNRSMKHRPFLMMESTPSLVNWHQYNKLKRPNMHMLSSMQAIAHGSDSVQYFQWRKSRGCSEKFHGAVVDHAGHENTRVFRDVAALGERLMKLDEIVGTSTKAQAAILFDWDNRWALEDAQGFAVDDKKIMPTLKKCYAPLWERGIDTDIISRDDDFRNYKLIIAPMLYMVSNELQQKLVSFVENGGILICTYMTGMVDENDLCHLGGFPAGKLKDVFGIINEEIDTLYPDETKRVRIIKGGVTKAEDYCEVIHTQGAEVLAEYDEDFYKGSPAATLNKYGKGLACYIAFRDEGDYITAITEEMLNKAGITSGFDGELPYGCTAHTRTDGEKVYVFLENYNHTAKELKTDCCWNDIENGKQYSDSIILEAFETKIIVLNLNE